MTERAAEPLRVVEVDSEDVAELAVRYRVRGVPTLILFKQGAEVARCTGFQSIGMLRDWAAPNIGGRLQKIL